MIATSPRRSLARRWLHACALALSSLAPAVAAPGVLVSMNDVYADIDRASSVTLCAFSLSPRGKMTQRLIAAARRGATVTVALDGRAFGFAASENAGTMPLFVAAGVRVHATRVPSHLKAVVVDGARTYLTDRNFTSRGKNEIVIRDPYDGDRLLVERAMLGVGGANGHLWLTKGEAIAAEAAMLDVRTAPEIDVQTESFGAGTGVYAVLSRRARAGDRVHLLVATGEYRRSATERRAVAGLVAAGVVVRTSSANEKVAIQGARAWVGSANLTQAVLEQIDFGFLFDDRAIADELAQEFAKNWDRGASL